MTKEEKFRRAQELKELIKNLATSCITNEELPYYVEQVQPWRKNIGMNISVFQEQSMIFIPMNLMNLEVL